MWPRRAPRPAEPDPAAPSAPAGRPASLDAVLRRLEWPVLGTFARRLGGGERSRQHAAGIDLVDLREYQPGDDVRQIDWNATARGEQVYVRESFAERGLDAWFLVDVSASIDWGTAECLKRERAAELVDAASRLLARQGNRIGLALFAGRGAGLVLPGSGRQHLQRVVETVRRTPRQTAPGPTDLVGALTHFRQVARRPSLVIVVSDFLAADGWQPALAALAQRHEVVAVRLTDPREAELPDVGLLTFEDPETGEQLTVDTADRKLRERFAAAARAQSERIRQDLQRCGVDELVLSTGAPMLPALVEFLTARRHRRQPAARSAAGPVGRAGGHERDEGRWPASAPTKPAGAA